MTKADGLNTARMWGALLRRFRLDAGVTQAGLAAHVGYTTDFAHSIELGRRMPSPVFVTKADEYLKADGCLIETATHLTREKPHAAEPEDYTAEEKTARSLWAFDTHVLHPLLRTEPYTRTLLTAHQPLLPDTAIDTQVTDEQQRQERLTGEPACSYAFIIEEWILHRPTGEPTTMKAQLAHLLALAELRNLTLQVMPISHHTHAGLDGPLTLLETPAHTWLAHIHAHDTHHLTNDPRHLSILHSRYTYLRSHALTPTDSTQLIQKLAEQL